MIKPAANCSSKSLYFRIEFVKELMAIYLTHMLTLYIKSVAVSRPCINKNRISPGLGQKKSGFHMFILYDENLGSGRYEAGAMKRALTSLGRLLDGDTRLVESNRFLCFRGAVGADFAGREEVRFALRAGNTDQRVALFFEPPMTRNFHFAFSFFQTTNIAFVTQYTITLFQSEYTCRRLSIPIKCAEKAIISNRATMKKSFPVFLVTITMLILPAGCGRVSPTASTGPTATASAVPTATALPSATAQPSTTQVPTQTATATPVPTTTPPTQPPVCSPLADYAISDLPGMITNPFNPPPPGSDDPHQAIDLSIRLAGSQLAVAGQPVQAVLAGRVAAVIHDRFPYGNAILIETPLETLPQGWLSAAQIPTPAPTLAPHSALTCPAGPPAAIPDPGQRSLYVLYAHMQNPPDFMEGDTVTCGQPIGRAGATGNALNPHLHLEMRAAPAGIRFGSLAHYDASATADEMRSYCLWRISGLFQLVDPMQVLQAAP
jgi:murein DD-endopeptidase MepM/ murein hydrolase activator NlpD